MLCHSGLKWLQPCHATGALGALLLLCFWPWPSDPTLGEKRTLKKPLELSSESTWRNERLGVLLLLHFQR